MQNTVRAQSLMKDFAASTGLIESSCPPRRYLWTDAFAVCNYLELYHQTGEDAFLELALKLIDQVHQVLGQHHKKSARRGWISGLNEKEAQQHPTRLGLRIGKRLNERQPGEPFDPCLGWDRDGQYFHYLTKWMHALNRASQVTNKSIYIQWALELAKVAYTAFTSMPPTESAKRIAWKMSVDLSHPLVNSTGKQDLLDGLITYQQLEATAKKFSLSSSEYSLRTEIEEMTGMCVDPNWITDDLLVLGELLTNAHKLVQLICIHALQETVRLEDLLHDIKHSLHGFISNNQLNLSAENRLAFRELGLTTGLHAISKMHNRIEQQPERFANARQLLALLTKLSDFYCIHELIEHFWLEPKHQAAKSWQALADINNVMLATSLIPDGYLQL